MSEAAKKELLLNEFAVDVDLEIGLTERRFNWLLERLRKLSHDLEQTEIDAVATPSKGN